MSGPITSATSACALLGLLCFGVPTSPALAQEGELQRCLAIPDIAERVRCYDVLARAAQEQVAPEQGVEAGTSEAAVPERTRQSSADSQSQALSHPPAPVRAATDQRVEFGLSAAQLESRRPAERQQLDAIRTSIASARTVGAGYWQFVTEEGSVWRMTEVRRSFRPPARGDGVVIRRGTLGSYYIDFDNQPALPVKRVG